MPHAAFFALLGEAWGSWAEALCGHPAQGLARVRRAWVQWRSQGQPWATVGLALPHAELSLLCGEIAEAEAIVAEGLANGFGTEQRCYHPELHRLRGDAWLARGNVLRAREDYRAAGALAQRQGAQLLEMRALRSLLDTASADTSVQRRMADLLQRVGDVIGGSARPGSRPAAPR